MIPVQVVGLGMSLTDLTLRTLDIIKGAQVLVGGRRHLAYFPEHPAEKIILGKDPEHVILKLGELAQYRQIVILASGDPNFFGIGPMVVRLLGPENVRIHPNITAVQAASGRLQTAWQMAQVVSLHGRGWESLDAALNAPGLWFIYTDPAHAPDAIARRLLKSGRIEARLCVLEDLGLETERFAWMSLDEAADRTFSPLNIVVLDLISAPFRNRQGRLHGKDPMFHLGMPEEFYCPERGLITKAEVRAVVLAKLELYPGQVLWDIGAGTGSVGLEASLLIGRGRIVAVEKNPKRAAQITANREKLQVDNFEVICGRAPACLAVLTHPDRVFIGGGGVDLEDILCEVLSCLRPGGKVALTATLLETLEKARKILLRENYLIDIIQLQVSRAQPLAGGSYLQTLNPVWVITGSALAR